MAPHTVWNSRPELVSTGLSLLSRRFQPRRYHAGGLSAWSGHLPFANDLVAALRPSVLVELGTHYGESYFGFCQAMEENGVDCKCYAVDTWRGDAHSGFYGESVFHEVREYNQAHYAAFSTLLRSTFDDANPHFSDASIGLLHIDGLHTYDAVKRDFELWLPRVRAGGVILLHDINVRRADFEVWRFWEELREHYECFEFPHSWGLGVVRVPDEDLPPAGLLTFLFRGSDAERHALREHYAWAAEYLELASRPPAPAQPDVPKPFLQVFGDRAGLYMEAGSVRVEVRPGEWRTYSAELAQGADSGRLRLDVAEYPCIVEISGIAVRRLSDNVLLFEYATTAEIEACRCSGDLMPLPAGKDARFLSFGQDPQLLVTAPEPVRLDLPIRIEVTMYILTGLEGAVTAREPAPGVSEDLTPAIEWKLAAARVESLRAEVLHQQTERVALVTEFRRAKAERNAFARECEAFRSSLAEEKDLRVRSEQEAAVLRLDLARRDSQRAELEADAGRLRSQVADSAQDRIRLDHAETERARWEADCRRLRSRISRLTDSRKKMAAAVREKNLEAERIRSEFKDSWLELEDAFSSTEQALRTKEAETARLLSELRESRQRVEQALSDAGRRMADAEHALRAKEMEEERLRAALASETEQRKDLLRSLSWRTTGPLRAVYGILGAGRPRNDPS